jgi:hypothetical protein
MPQKRGYSESGRDTEIKTYYECKSGRAVGRLLGMSRSNAVRWIKERAKSLPEADPKTAEHGESVEVIELDEMFHFTKKRINFNKGKCLHNACSETGTAPNRGFHSYSNTLGWANAGVN